MIDKMAHTRFFFFFWGKGKFTLTHKRLDAKTDALNLARNSQSRGEGNAKNTLKVKNIKTENHITKRKLELYIFYIVTIFL